VREHTRTQYFEREERRESESTHAHDILRGKRGERARAHTQHLERGKEGREGREREHTHKI
jgi:hypothetical protein